MSNNQIDVRLTPPQGININNTTVYVYEGAVGDATLTIQKNGTTIDTFTANAKIDKTIDIIVPTTASDINALPDTTKYGSSITVSMNTTDYKITTTLIDQNGDQLGTAQIIDLPLESVVVSGSYDSVNKKIVLTLQNGNTVDIPVSDLISGLQSTITGGATTITDNNLSTNKALISNANGKVDVSTVTSTELGYVSGVTSGIQSQLNNKADASSLATVATSGDYGDLLNTPTITTVNDATLTIQQNGTTLDTFTANSSTNVTVNIQTPTKSNILGWVLPDYSSKITTTVGTNTTYTCPSAGFITLVVNNSLTQGGILINDVAPQSNDKLYVDGQYFVDQGDIIKASGFTSQTLVFFPLKGV